MGIFSRRKKTTVEKETTKTAISKIVKFSYLQTLAIDGGLGNVRDLAGETEATEEEFNDSQVNENLVERLRGKVSDTLTNLGDLFSGPIFSGIASALFGKKVSRDVNVNVKDSGFTVTKTWNQPQFDVIRYALGIREISLAQFTYEKVSEFTSQPWLSPKEITKVNLIVDQFIPSEFPLDTNYIEYYIKPDISDAQWIRINPLDLPTVYNSDGSIVPRIISFNTEQPVNANLESSYINTESPVKSIRFKAVFKRPDSIEGRPEVSANAYSPVLKSYRLLLTPRNGLGV